MIFGGRRRLSSSLCVCGLSPFTSPHKHPTSRSSRQPSSLCFNALPALVLVAWRVEAAKESGAPHKPKDDADDDAWGFMGARGLACFSTKHSTTQPTTHTAITQPLHSSSLYAGQGRRAGFVRCALSFSPPAGFDAPSSLRHHHPSLTLPHPPESHRHGMSC